MASLSWHPVWVNALIVGFGAVQTKAERRKVDGCFDPVCLHAEARALIFLNSVGYVGGFFFSSAGRHASNLVTKATVSRPLVTPTRILPRHARDGY